MTNLNDELKLVISLLEEDITKKEEQAKDLDWDIKVKKSKLKQLKKVME